MSELTKRLRDIPLNLRTVVPVHYSAAFTKHEQAPTVNALDAGIVAHESADRIDALEECLREFYRVVDQVTPDNRERVFPPSIVAAYEKARALLESK